jgi:membrane protease YdiL (CAAX protease family)
VNDREFVNFGFNFSLDWTVWVGLGLGLLGLAYIIYLYRFLKNDKEPPGSIRAKMQDTSISLYMPRTKNEFRWFIILSISAGICEELLYRGFLMWYISQFATIIVAVL